MADDELVRVVADKVAETIRAVDGKHTMGAGALGDEIAAALAPLIRQREVKAHFEAVPGGLYNRVMEALMKSPTYDALFAANDLKDAIGASAKRDAYREVGLSVD